MADLVYNQKRSGMDIDSRAPINNADLDANLVWNADISLGQVAPILELEDGLVLNGIKF